jgi:hypothetical protein
MDLKDHFEHLRTVHFSLIATCLVLLVVSTTSQNRTVRLAEDQLRSVQSIMVHWADLDFDAAIDRQVQSSSMQVPHSRILKFSDGVLVPKPGSYVLDFTMPAWSPITSEQCTPWLYDPMLKRQPRTLADTHELWDCLHTANSVAIPFAFSAEAAVLRGKKVSLADTAPTAPAGHLKLVFGKTSEDQRATIRQAFGLSVDYAFVGTLYSSNGAQENIIVPVEKERVIKLNLVEPLRPLDPAFSVDPGLYPKAFPDLDEITADYEDLTFDKLSAILAAQRKHSDQTFEAFSVKFPSEAVARWGLILLLGVQLYLLIHMASVPIRPDTEISVAWIPLYPNKLAQSVFMLTVAVLPPLTAGIIGHVGSITGRRNIDTAATTVAVLLSLVLAFQTLKVFARGFPGVISQKMSKLQVRGRRVF